MAFEPNFQITQNYGSIADITIIDTSTGTDLTITDRVIYLRKDNGTYLTPTGSITDYIVWLISGNQLVISDILDKDYALDVTVNYYSGSTVIYTKTILNLFTAYSDLFLRQLTQALAANRVTITQRNFWLDKNKLRVLLDDATQAVTLINDQTIAQFCLDEAKKLTDNIQTFF